MAELKDFATEALYNFTAQNLLDNLNKLNSTNVQMSEISFSKPKKAEGTWTKESGHGDTLVRIMAKQGSSLSGSSLLSYDRVNVDMMATMFGHQIFLPKKITTVHDALPWFGKRFGMVFYKEDFKDGAITHGEGATFVLEAVETSLVYSGKATIKVGKMPPDISDDIESKFLVEYPANVCQYKDVMPADLLLYNYDATSVFDEIKPFTTENYDAQKFYDNVLNKPWNHSYTCNSLFGRPDHAVTNGIDLAKCKLAYNGLNSGIDNTRKDFKYVCILELPEDNKRYVGNIYIHYNDPSDSLEV